MKSLACKDLGVDCHFVATGTTEKEVMDKMMQHAMEAHPEKLEEAKRDGTQDEMMDMMTSMIKDE